MAVEVVCLMLQHSSHDAFAFEHDGFSVEVDAAHRLDRFRAVRINAESEVERAFEAATKKIERSAKALSRPGKPKGKG